MRTATSATSGHGVQQGWPIDAEDRNAEASVVLTDRKARLTQPGVASRISCPVGISGASIGGGDPNQTLSAELRVSTSELHRQVERLLNLPDAIVTRDDYQRWLTGFFGFYQPLEARLMTFPDWDGLGIPLASRLRSSAIARDLAVLGCGSASAPLASLQALPELPTLAHALGALYVLEGATLGGQIILRAIEAQAGLAIGGAKQFFGGRGRENGPMWNAFREQLNEFGTRYPVLRQDVVAGAQRTFEALLIWFSPVASPAEQVHGV